MKNNECNLFTGTPDEWEILKLICSNWSFWSYHSIKETLSFPSTKLIYIKGYKDITTPWMGLALFKLSVDFADLMYVYVDGSCRRQGIGRHLLECMILQIKKNVEIKDVFLEVRISNTGAHALYEKFGMKKIDRRKKYYPCGEDALIYKYSIS